MSTFGVYGLTFGSILLINVSIAAGALVVFSGLSYLFPAFFQPQRYKQHTFSRFPWFLDVFLRPLNEFATRGDLALLYVLHQTAVLIMLFIMSILSIFVLIPIYKRGTMQGSYASGWSSITISHLEGNCMSFAFPLITTFIYTFVVLFYYTQARTFCIHIQQNLSPSRYILLLHLPKELRRTPAVQVACQSVYGPVLRGIIPITSKCHKAIKCINAQEKLAHKASVKLCECEWYTCILHKEIWAGSYLENRGRRSRFCRGVSRKVFMLKQMRTFRKLKRSKQAFSKLLHKLDEAQMELDISLLGQPISAAQYQSRMEEIEYPDFSDYQCLRAFGSDPMEGFGGYEDKSGDGIDLSQWLNELDVRSVVLEFADPGAAQKASQLLFSSNMFKPRVLSISPRHVLWSNLHMPEVLRTALQIAYVILMAIYLALYFLPSTTLINLVNKHSNKWFSQLYQKFCQSEWGSCKSRPLISGETRESIGSLNCYVCYKISSYLIVFLPTLITMTLNSLLPIMIGVFARLCRPVFVTSLRIIEYQTIFWFLIIIQGVLQIVLPSILSEVGVMDYSLLLNYSLNQVLTQIGRNMPNQVFSFLTYVCTKYFLFSILSLFRPMDMLMAVINKIMYQRSYWPIRSYSAASRFNFAKLSAYSSHMLCIGFLFGIIAPVSLPVVTIAYALMAAVDRYNILHVYSVGDESWLSPSPNILFSIQNTIFVGFTFMLVATGAYYLLLTGPVRIICSIINAIFLVAAIFVKKTHDRKYSVTPSHLGMWRETGLEKKSIFQIDEDVWKVTMSYGRVGWGRIGNFETTTEFERKRTIEEDAKEVGVSYVGKHFARDFERLSRYIRIQVATSNE